MEKIAAITVTRQGIEIGPKMPAAHPSAHLYLSTKYGRPEGAQR